MGGGEIYIYIILIALPVISWREVRMSVGKFGDYLVIRQGDGSLDQMDTTQMERSGWIGDLFWNQRTITP